MQKIIQMKKEWRLCINEKKLHGIKNKKKMQNKVKNARYSNTLLSGCLFLAHFFDPVNTVFSVPV
jgi:hypothetical protein